MSEHTEADTVVATPKPASRWEDFIDIFYAPADVFARREKSGFFIPMLVVTALVGGIFLANSGVMQPMMDAEFSRQTALAVKQNPNVTPEMMEKMRGFTETIGKVGAFIFMPIGIFLTGLALWLVGKLFESKATLGAALMVSSYAFVPRIIDGVVAGVQGLLMDPASLNGRLKLTLGVGRFLDPDASSQVLQAAVGRIDVFTIWVTVLLVIGISVVGKIPRSKAALVGVLVWVLGGLVPLLTALRNS